MTTILSTGAVYAADASTRMDAMPVPPAMPNWNGFYAGFGLGGLMGSGDVDFLKNEVLETPSTTAPTGFLATVEGGYDFQTGPMVLGLTANYDFTLGTSHGDFSKDKDHTGNVQLNGSWGIGGRIGTLINSNTLLFGSGGYAGTQVKVTLADPPPPDENAVDSSGTLNGFYVGGGMETMLKGGWSLKGEYRFASYSAGFETADYKTSPPAPDSGSLDLNNLTTQSVRLTLDRRF